MGCWSDLTSARVIVKVLCVACTVLSVSLYSWRQWRDVQQPDKHSSCGNGFFFSVPHHFLSELQFIWHSCPLLPLSRTGHEWSVGYSVSYRPDSSVWLLYEWTGHGLLWLAKATWRVRDLMFRLTQPGSVSPLLLLLLKRRCALSWMGESERVLGYMCLSKGP